MPTFNMLLHVWHKFLKVSSVFFLYSKLSSELTFENFASMTTFNVLLHVWDKFSNVISVVILCSKLSSELIFEIFRQYDDTPNVLPHVWLDAKTVRMSLCSVKVYNVGYTE